MRSFFVLLILIFGANSWGCVDLKGFYQDEDQVKYELIQLECREVHLIDGNQKTLYLVDNEPHTSGPDQDGITYTYQANYSKPLKALTLDWIVTKSDQIYTAKISITKSRRGDLVIKTVNEDGSFQLTTHLKTDMSLRSWYAF